MQIRENKTVFVKLVGCTILTLAMAGCAVTNGEIDKAYNSDEQLATKALQEAPEPMPLVEDLPTAFLGTRTAAVPYESTLPPPFHEKLLTFAAGLSITDIANQVSSLTGYAVHLSPDVFMSRDEFVPRGEVDGKAGRAVNLAQPLPQIGAPSAGPVYPLRCADCQVGNYLHDVTENLGLDYSFDGTTINIARFVTRTFVLEGIPGKTSIKSETTKGTDTTTGSQAGGSVGVVGNSSTGSFNSTTKVSRGGGSADWDYFEQIKSELNDLKSPPGKVEVDPQNRLVFVHDIKENVEHMSQLIERENSVSSRQVAVHARIMQFSLNGGVQAGLSANVIFNSIQGGLAKWAVSAVSPSALTTATGGTIGVTVLKPNAPLSGTNAAIQAVNSFGKTIVDDSFTKMTLNGVPVPLASYETKGYLAATTPSNGSIAGSTSGVPGLTPGSVTVGKFINFLPLVNDSNRITLSYWNDTSQLNGPFTTISTGTDATQQSIQLTDVIGNKDEQHVDLVNGQTIVLYGEMSDQYDASNNLGLAGGSSALDKTRTFQIVMLSVTVVPTAK
jgi:hypothetical protein